MNCERAQDLITRSISGNASGDDEAQLRDHLAACSTCAEMHRRLDKVWDLMGEMPRVALSEAQTRAVSSRVRRGPASATPVFSSHRRWAAAGFAAALFIGIVVYLSLPSSQPVVEDPGGKEAGVPQIKPVESVQRAPLPVPSEDHVHAEKILEQIVEQSPVPAPQPKQVVKAPEPKPAPVVKQPEPETPKVKPAPEKKPAPVVQAPKPEKPEPKPAAPTLPIVAKLVQVNGPVFVVADGKRIAAESGRRLLSGHGLATHGRESHAVVEYADGTRVVLGGDTVLSALTEQEGKVVALESGILACDVARQPRGKDMRFVTPQAEARVLGTRLTLTVNKSTLLEVHKGRVRLTRKSDGAAAEVSSGRFAVAAAGIKPKASRITRRRIALSDPFSGSRWGQLWAMRVESGSSSRFKVKDGHLSLPFPAVGPDEVAPSGFAPTKGGALPPDVTQKAMDSVLIGSRAEWPRTTWLETRRAFPLIKDAPLRIIVKLWQSHSDANRAAWICLNRRDVKELLVLERRGDTLQLWSGSKKTSLWKAGRPSAAVFETLEVWIAQDQIVVRRNDDTLHVGPNPSPLTRTIQVSLGGGAKSALAQDQEIRFDDVEVAWMSQADLQKILK